MAGRQRAYGPQHVQLLIVFGFNFELKFCLCATVSDSVG